MSISPEMLKRDYERVRSNHPDAGLKPYDELTADEKAKHESIYRDTAAYFHKLGEAIRKGSPLPDPFSK